MTPHLLTRHINSGPCNFDGTIPREWITTNYFGQVEICFCNLSYPSTMKSRSILFWNRVPITWGWKEV